MIFNNRRAFVLISAVLTLAPALVTSVAAEEQHYLVTLEDGKTFETRYLPYASDDEPDVTHLLTDKGNWIALATPKIADVETRHNGDGFGRQVDTTTRFLGVTWVEEDLEEPDFSLHYELPEPLAYRDPFQWWLGPTATEPNELREGIPLDIYGYDGPYCFEGIQ